MLRLDFKRFFCHAKGCEQSRKQKMTSQLSLKTIQSNCAVFLTANFTNMYADTNESVKGFSNWNVFSKLTKVTWDYYSNYEEYKKVRSVILKTLEGIEDQFQVKQGICPLYFVIVNGGYFQGFLQVPYSDVLQRLNDSLTFKDDPDIQNSVERVTQICNKHPLGSDLDSIKGEVRDLFKHTLKKKIAKDFKRLYDPEFIASSNSEKEGSVLLPEDPMDLEKMHHYLQEKVKSLAKTSIFKKN